MPEMRTLITSSDIDRYVNPVEVLARAILEVKFEDEVKFDKEYHKLKFDKTGETLGCGCEYCITLHSYTSTCKELHRVNKRITSDDYIFITRSEESYTKDRLERLKLLKKNLKSKKDNLKKKLGV